MILAASIICKNEQGRYLPILLEDLRSFCDQITILDDGSTDGTVEFLHEQADDVVTVASNRGASFDQHEGAARQALLELTVSRQPTHVLAIDADEIISDGQALRATIEASPDVETWTLKMVEIWVASEDALSIRSDGGWHPYDAMLVWKVPVEFGPTWRIMNRKLACRRVPMAAMQRNASATGQTVYHFGWADPATRRARYDRYMRLDRGRFHARSHLQSIVWPEHRIRQESTPWPDADWTDAVRQKLAGMVAA